MKEIITKHQTFFARLILLLLVVVACLPCVIWRAPDLSAKAKDLERRTIIELDSIPMPSNTYILPGHERGDLSKGRGITYIRLYKSTLSYYGIYTHYIKEMGRNGWVVTQDTWIEFPYLVIFQKGEFKAELVKPKAPELDVYALYIETQIPYSWFVKFPWDN